MLVAKKTQKTSQHIRLWLELLDLCEASMDWKFLGSVMVKVASNCCTWHHQIEVHNKKSDQMHTGSISWTTWRKNEVSIFLHMMLPRGDRHRSIHVFPPRLTRNWICLCSQSSLRLGLKSRDSGGETTCRKQCEETRNRRNRRHLHPKWSMKMYHKGRIEVSIGFQLVVPQEWSKKIQKGHCSPEIDLLVHWVSSDWKSRINETHSKYLGNSVSQEHCWWKKGLLWRDVAPIYIYIYF